MKLLTFLDTGIFPATILFSVGLDHQGILKELRSKRMDRKSSDPWIRGLMGEVALVNSQDSFGVTMRRDLENLKTKKSISCFYVIIKRFDRTDFDYAALAHEILHVCQFFLPDVLDRNKEHEAEAYLHSHLMMQCLRAMK